MLQVYAIPVSLYCAKLRIVLRHKNLSWTEVPPPGGYGSDEYRQIVASGNLPALRDADLLIADSEAIAEYLNEQYPDPPMLPTRPADRAMVRQLSRFHDTRLEPAVRALFPHVGQPSRDRPMLQALADTVVLRLTQLPALLPATFSDLTLGDCGYPITLCWIDALAAHFGLPIASPPAVTAYRTDVMGVDAVSAELAEYRPRLITWLAAQ